MLIYCLRRLFGLIPVGLGVVAIVSLLIHIVPGDPVDVMLGPYATLEEKVKLRTDLGLNAPVHQQILEYYKGIAAGNLGQSLIYREPVTTLISRRIQPTIELAVCALIIALCISLPIGIGRTMEPWDSHFWAFAFLISC